MYQSKERKKNYEKENSKCVAVSIIIDNIYHFKITYLSSSELMSI